MKNINAVAEEKRVMKKVMRPLRYAWIVTAICFIFFFFLLLLVRIPSVQNYIAQRTTSILEDRLHTKVEIGKVDIDLFNGIELEDLYIEDLKGDTLIYAGAYYSEFYNSVRSFYNKQFNISYLNLSDGFINLSRTKDDPLNNLQRLLNQSFDPYQIEAKAETLDSITLNDAAKPKSISIALKKINLDRIRFRNVDSLSGYAQNGYINTLDADLDSFDINEMRFVVSKASIEDVNFTHNKFEKDTLLKPLPEQEAKKLQEFDLKINDLHLKSSNFKFKDLRYSVADFPTNSFNSKDFEITGIELQGKDLAITEPYFLEGTLSSFEANFAGLQILESTAKRIFIDKRKSGLEDFQLNTRRSKIKRNLIFKYRNFTAWTDFVNQVILDGDLESSVISMKDLAFFAPRLLNNQFVVKNLDEKITISSKLTGRINQLNARNLNLNISNNLQLKGSFIARDLTDPDESLLNVTVERLKTNMLTLKQLIPGFSVPQNFYKLNAIDFNGRFDGYYQDFVAYGDLITDLGRADVDMRLNLKEGSRNANYSGKMNLFDFDLKSWTGLDDFDRLSFSANVSNGRGLELSTAYAELGGEVISFGYKGYNYNGIIDAKLEQNLFDGSLKMTDKNIDFDFLGNINFQEEIPLYDFKADVKSINPKALNLSKDITFAQGLLDIKLKGTTIDNIIGSALGDEITIVRNQDTLDFGHLALASTLENEIRSIFLDSDVGSGEIIGQYKLTELPNAVLNLLKRNYPSFTNNLNLLGSEPQGNVIADFQIELKEASDLLSFFSLQEASLEKLSAEGHLNYDKNELETKINLPKLSYGDYHLTALVGEFDIDANQGDFIAKIDSGSIKNVKLSNLNLEGAIRNDTLTFALRTNELLDSISNIEISGNFAQSDELVFASLDKLNFEVLGDSWRLSKNNKVFFGKEHIDVTNFRLTDNYRSIRVKSTKNKRGIETQLDNLQLFLVNRWIGKEDFVLNGDVTAKLILEDIFDTNGLFIESSISKFKVNDQALGKISFDARTDFATKLISYEMKLDHFEHDIFLDGSYSLASKVLGADIRVEGFPLNFLENLLKDNISKTSGRIYGRMKVNGLINDLMTTGNGEIRDGFTRINYLGTNYSFEQAKFTLKKNFIDFTDAQLRDSREQVAIIDGGITHESFNNLGCDLTITSDKFILLNTNASLNPTYYGFGQGRANVSMKGPFSDMNMKIGLTTAEDTKLTLPVSYVNTTRDQSFIPIVSKADFLAKYNNEEEKLQANQYVGLNLQMDLTVTPAAEMTILFDPVTGHKLTGRGSGDLQLFLHPITGINMFGNYFVDQGKYDFALQNIIKKEFNIRKDGKVTFAGYPLDAKIDIAADYQNLRTPLNTFLIEFLENNEDLANRAKQDQDVNLTVFLTEKLLNPTISFDIDFPNLTGELRSIAENKLATLKADPLGLNNQVFGLLIFNNFLPYDNPIATSNIGSSFSVIVSELLSAQLSAYVSSIFQSVLDENGLIYDVDVDVRVENSLGGSDQSTAYGLTVTPKINSDKFEIILGGDYLSNNPGESIDPYATGDFIFDYFLEDDKKIKLRVYGRTDKDITDGRTQRLGAGIYIRREFSSFRDLRASFQKEAKLIKENEKTNKGDE